MSSHPQIPASTLNSLLGVRAHDLPCYRNKELSESHCQLAMHNCRLHYPLKPSSLMTDPQTPSNPLCTSLPSSCSNGPDKVYVELVYCQGLSDQEPENNFN